MHGIVRTLVEHGMVVQERGSGRYQLGPAVLTLGNVYLDTLELRSRAIPWAEDLARRTGLAVRTGVLLIDDVVIIHHEPRPTAPADARGRHRHPRPRQRPGQGDARLRRRAADELLDAPAACAA